MEYVIAWPIFFLALSIVWVIVLVLYNLIFEPFDFGPLGSFAGKSALLIAIMATIYVMPYVNWFSLIAWWFGLMVVFKKDFWECRILVFLIWGVTFIIRLFLSGILLG